MPKVIKPKPQEQIERLANYLMEFYPDDIIEGGAVDVAIAILKKQRNRRSCA